MNPRTVAFLKSNVALLADFDEASCKNWLEGSRTAAFSPGEVLVHAGDEVHSLGVILEGKIAASAGSDGQRQRLGQLGPGETFGEMALISGDPAMADFVAAEQSRVMLVPLTLFQTQIMAEPRALQHISRTIGDAPAEGHGRSREGRRRHTQGGCRRSARTQRRAARSASSSSTAARLR